MTWLAWVAACADGARDAAPTGPSAPVAPLARVVMVTAATGFRHSSIDVAERLLPALAAQAGIAQIVLARTPDDTARLLAPAALASLDGVAFVNTTGDPGVPDLPALLAWIAAGHGVAATHSASDTYHHRPEFLDMLGNAFLTHGDQALVEAVVEQPSHPAVAHLGSRYRVFDEIYRFTTANRGAVTPLLALTRYPDDGLPQAGQPADLPMAWTRAYDRGRVFYTALGHRDELWADVEFQQHVLGGLRWALNR